MDGTESTLSYLEKTASSIDESKSAFKATLSNITKPTPDMLGYGGGGMGGIGGTQSLYGSSNNSSSNLMTQQQPVKPKPKPRPRGRKAATKVDPVPSSPVQQSLPMNKGGLVDKPALISSNNIKENNPKPSSIGGHWRMDETNAVAGSGMGSSYVLAAEKNLTIPHTDVNTTYNHSNQTYQQYSSPHSSSHSRIGSGSGSGSGAIPTHPHSQSKSETSSMYSSHGSVHHHPYSARTESTSTVTTNSVQTSSNSASMSAHNPYSVHSMSSSVSQATSNLSSSNSYLNSQYESAKLGTATTTTTSSGTHLLSSAYQEQTTTPAAAALASATASLSQIDPLGLHSQHYSPYGK